MNRNQGLTASAIVLTGAMLRGSLTGSSGVSPQVSPSNGVVTTAAQALTGKGEGPWKASCNYWKAGQNTSPPTESRDTGGKALSSVTITLSHDEKSLDSHITGLVGDNKASCGPNDWGIPVSKAPGNENALGITTIIATVPDPLHSSLPLEFDRTIEALTEAAAQYGYVSSYFWLPWKRSSADAGKANTDTEAPSKDDADREKQPGLLILKQDHAVPFVEKATASPSGNSGVLYLFLIGASPANGVNGDQIGNALRYGEKLNSLYKAKRSFRNFGNEVGIIGPDTSGSAASLRAALESHGNSSLTYEIAGNTSTHLAVDVLNARVPGDNRLPNLNYCSFGADSYHERNEVISHFTSTSPNGDTRLALLTEAGTVFGSLGVRFEAHEQPAPLIIPFPRDISVLRNALTDKAGSAESAAAANVSPYLHLSLKDSSATDLVAPFAGQQYTFSQEAQWMAITRELKDKRINVVAVSASNILDELFLIKSIRRDLPDVQVVTYDGGDLLFARIGDNESYIGDVAFTVYPLTELSSMESVEHYNFPDAITEAYFNAAAYTFWDGGSDAPHLADYRNPFADAYPTHPALWATVVGRDGYYPLSLMDSNPRDKGYDTKILPDLSSVSDASCGAAATQAGKHRQPEERSGAGGLPVNAVSPGFTWYLLCLSITLLCAVHGIMLSVANFWSPVTHDLAVKYSDRPRRRAVYLNIGGAVLFAMSFTAAFPVLPAWRLLHGSYATALTAIATVLSGVFSGLATWAKTKTFLGHARPCPRVSDAPSLAARELAAEDTRSEARFFPAFNALALLTAVLVPAFWVALCVRNNVMGPNAYLGLFFSYRCLFPASGVCPLLPLLLILLTWYIWAHVQTKRLRFSENRRPMLPGMLDIGLPRFYYVSDEELSSSSSSINSCLYERATCLLITRQLIRRALSNPASYLNWVLGCAYIVLLVCFIFFIRVHGLDHFFHKGRLPGLYEALISGLFFPLLVIAIAGCVRLFAIWAALNRGLLEPLERSPLRFAFSRMQGVSWMSMLRQSGVYEHWRDMTRSLESMRQLLSVEQLHEALYSRHAGVCSPADAIEKVLYGHLQELFAAIEDTHSRQAPLVPDKTRLPVEFLETVRRLCKQLVALAKPSAPPQPQNFLLGDDVPCGSDAESLNLLCAMESDFAEFAKALLASVLGPYWLCKRSVFVANDPVASEPSAESSTKFEDGIPREIQLAEEYVAIRYIALIRAVLINLRYLTTFVATAFVLALLAWNSYPFQPRQWVDWTFTFLLFGSFATVFGVYAQMHRSPILSRITGTTANELGIDFFWRLFGFGTIPFLTWLASQFPAVSNLVSRLVQSAPAK